jgi:hypothetical protein
MGGVSVCFFATGVVRGCAEGGTIGTEVLLDFEFSLLDECLEHAFQCGRFDLEVLTETGEIKSAMRGADVLKYFL